MYFVLKSLKFYLHYSALHVLDTTVSIIRSFSAAHAVSGPVWCFIVPDGCYCPVQFLFGVLIFLDFTCLFGIDKFQVHGSVHRCNNLNKNAN